MVRARWHNAGRVKREDSWRSCPIPRSSAMHGREPSHNRSHLIRFGRDAMELREAIDSYHDLLTPDVARETQAQLDDQLRRRGLFFGARPLTTVLRPRFLTPAQYHHLQAALRPVLA